MDGFQALSRYRKGSGAMRAKKRSEAAGNAIYRGIGIDRIGVEKATFDFSREVNGAQAKKKMCGPRKARCVDFSWQTYGNAV